MAFDLAGTRLFELMQKRDVRWLNPPHPTWRIEPPSRLRWLLGGGWRAKDYDERLVDLIAAILRDYPGSYVAYHLPPEGLTGTWQPAPVAAAAWREGQAGTAKRHVEQCGAVWILPADAEAAQVARWLRHGGWSIWKPGSKRAGVPRRLAQETFKTVVESDYDFLLSSSWDNQFSELSLHPERA